VPVVDEPASPNPANERDTRLSRTIAALRGAIPALWRLGTRDQPPVRAREITLTNQIALLAVSATLPYLAFYLTDLGHYFVVFAANLPFVGSYLLTLFLNRAGRFRTARVAVLGAVCVQLFVITALISTSAGVHLFYFSLAASLGLLFATRMTLLLIGLAAILFVVCHLAFPPGTTPVAIPDSTSQMMYVASAVGTVLVTGGFSYLCRLEINRAESALIQSNRALERLSGVDTVTDVANRRALDEYLAREWRRLQQHGGTVSVALVDVDCFKAYNDYYGHLAGDRCLQRVAETLRAATRRRDDLIARYGGEEFVIALPAASEEYAAEVAEHVRASVMSLGIPHDCSSVAPVITVSIGVASGGPDELDDVASLLHRADTALYAAKREGRNCVVRWQTLGEDASLTARRRKIAALRANIG
jgi:diguanylate cyclase (GGDEF)-like protein